MKKILLLSTLVLLGRFDLSAAETVKEFFSRISFRDCIIPVTTASIGVLTYKGVCKGMECLTVPKNGFYSTYTKQQFKLMQESPFGTFSRCAVASYSGLVSSVIKTPSSLMIGMVFASVFKIAYDKLVYEYNVPGVAVGILPFVALGAKLVMDARYERNTFVNPLKNEWVNVYRNISSVNNNFTPMQNIGWIGPIPKELEYYIKTMQQSPTKRALFALHPKNGFLLHGAPGQGKTFMITEVARRLNASLMIRKASDILNLYVGGTEKNIAQLVENAFRLRESEGKEWTVLFVDEIDGLVPKRDETASRFDLRNTDMFLQEIEKAAAQNVLFIGATNHLEKIDPAIQRSGRLEPILVAGPNEQERLELLKCYSRFHFGGNIPPESLLAKWAEQNKYSSRADIMTFVKDFALECAERLSTNDLVRKPIEELAFVDFNEKEDFR